MVPTSTAVFLLLALCALESQARGSPSPTADYAALASSGPRGKKVAVKPTNCISAAHQTAVLTCSTQRFYHRAISTITWYKDGRLVNYTASPRYSVQWGGRRFSIDMVTPGEDDGVFTCVVEEMSGKVYGNSASVMVEAEDSFLSDCVTFDGYSSYINVKDSSVFTGWMMPTVVTDFSLSFKPTQDSGAIFAAFDAQCSEHMVVALCFGILKLSVDLGAGRMELSASNVVINEWNTLIVSRISNAVTMTVNGVNTQKLASMKMSGLDTTNLWIGTGEVSWRCRSLWASLKCPTQDISFKGSIRGVASSLGGGAVDLMAPSTADGYNVAHCPEQ